MASGGMKLIGDKALERKLKTLGERVQRKILRSAVSAAATPVLKSARQKAPTESKLLKKSLGRKLTTNTKKQSVTAIIGARKEVQGEYKGKLRKPARYSHLAEKGFIRPDGSHSPPRAFLNPALHENESQSEAIMRTKLAEGVTREAMKGAA